jgi:hypothetical protein
VGLCDDGRTGRRASRPWTNAPARSTGYGEPAVTTDGGRIIAIFLMVTGIGFVAA